MLILSLKVQSFLLGTLKRDRIITETIISSNMEINFHRIFITTQIIADSQREYNDAANDKETSTHTVIVFHLLNVGDKVRVQFNKVRLRFIFDRNKVPNFKVSFVMLSLTLYV